MTTTITFYKSGGYYYGFTEQGHTGYAESGNDIVCAALSSMTMLLINAIEVCYGCNVDYKIDDKSIDISVTVKSEIPVLVGKLKIKTVVEAWNRALA